MSKYLFYIFVFFISFQVFSAEVEWNSRLEGENIQGGSLLIQDGDFNKTTRKYVSKKQYSYVRFGIGNKESGINYLDKIYQIQLLISYYDEFSNKKSIETKTLTLHSYSDPSKQDVLEQELSYLNSKKIEVSVKSLSDDIIPQLYLEVGFKAERYYELDYTSKAQLFFNAISYDTLGGVTRQNLASKSVLDVSKSDVEISWNHIEGAEYYQLEWSWIDNYDRQASTIDLTPLQFKNNCTRVDVYGNHYKIPNVFSKGFIVFRVRAVGVWTENTDKEKIAVWSSGEMNEEYVSDWKHFVEVNKEHQAEKNWKYEASYSEGGKRKDVVSYFDGSLRTRQNVTRTNSNDIAIIGETIYDHIGRANVQILPTPDKNPSLTFRNAYNVDLSKKPLSHENFDVKIDSSLSILKLSTRSGAGKYYDTLMHKNETDWQQYVPSAEGFPYTQTVYTPDNSGRILTQSGLGLTHNISTSNKTEYMYLQPTQNELNRLFGYDVGYSKRYKKNIVIDPNGQSQVSYLNASGKLVASALVGDRPINLRPINNKDVAKPTVNDILSKNNAEDVDTDSDNNILESSGKLGPYYDRLTSSYPIGAFNRTEYDINYQVTNPEIKIKNPCNATEEMTFKGEYDLTLSLKNNKGENLLSFTPILEKQANTTYSNTLLLEKGSYSLSKTLVVNKNKLEENWKTFYASIDKKNCTTLTKRIVGDTMANCGESCSSCLQQLGSFTDFRETVSASLFSKSYSSLSLDEQNQISFFYNQRIAECTAPCVLNLDERTVYEMMLSDVSPKGQYFPVSADTTLMEYGVGMDNLTSETNIFNCNWKSSTITYRDEDNSLSMINIAKINGVYVPAVLDTTKVITVGNKHITPPTNLKYINSFISEFRPSWAKALLKYHPEYYLLTYIDTLAKTKHVLYSDVDTAYISSSEFDAYVDQRAFTFETALSNSNNQVYSPTSSRFYTLKLIDKNKIKDTTRLLYNLDPYFQTQNSIDESVFGSARKNQLMKKSIDYYQEVKVGNTLIRLSMLSYAVAITMNKSFADASNYTWLTVLNSNEFNDTLRDQVWQKYISFYFSRKNEIKQLMMDLYGFKLGEFNGFIGDEKAIIPTYSKLNKLDPSITKFVHQKVFSNLFGRKNVLKKHIELATKEKRFERTSFTKQSELSEAAQIAAMQEQADYMMWKNTGKCPMVTGVNLFVNDMITSGLKLTSSGVGISSLYQTPVDFTKIISGKTLAELQVDNGNTRINSAITSITNSITYSIHTGNSGISKPVMTLSFPTEYNLNLFKNTWDIASVSDFFPKSPSSGVLLVSFKNLNTNKIQQRVIDFTIDTTINKAFNLTACNSEYAVSNSLDPNCKKREILESDFKLFFEHLQQTTPTSTPVKLFSIPSLTTSILLDLLGDDVSYEVKSDRVSFVGNNKTLDLIGDLTFQTHIDSIYSFNFTKLVGKNLEVLTSFSSNGEVNTFTETFQLIFESNQVASILPLNCTCEELKNIPAKTNATAIKKDLKIVFNKILADFKGKSKNALASPYYYPFWRWDFGHYLYFYEESYTSFQNYFGTDYLSVRTGYYDYESLQDFVNQNHKIIASSGDFYYPTTLNIQLVKENPYSGVIFDSLHHKFRTDDGFIDFCNIDFTITDDHYNILKNDTTWAVTSVFVKDSIYGIVLNNKVLVRGTSDCKPLISTDPDPVCYDCQPIIVEPLSCDDTYSNYKSYFDSKPDLQDAVVEQDVYCNGNFAYITESYLHYLSELQITSVETDDFLSLADFGNTFLGYSNDRLNLAVNAFISYKNSSSSNKMLWVEWVDVIYKPIVLADKPYLCPVILPAKDFPSYEISLEDIYESCDLAGKNIAKMNESSQLELFEAEEKEHFYRMYINQMMSGMIEKFTIGYDEEEYQFTLYYYDQAGNLIKTVPPGGVDTEFYRNMNTTNSYMVNELRALNSKDETMLPNHSKATLYRYNSLNQLVYQKTPDGGETFFAYDALGRIIASQNAKQKNNTEIRFTSGHQISMSYEYNAPKYSYSYYDGLGRVVEVGEFTDYNNALLISDYGKLVYRNNPAKEVVEKTNAGVPQLDWLNNSLLQPQTTTSIDSLGGATLKYLYSGNLRQEVVKTIYDDISTLSTKNSQGDNVTIQNVFNSYSDYAKNNRNRILGVINQPVYTPGYQSFANGMFYKYDIHGNVKELLQVNNDSSLVSVDRNIVSLTYDYDIISGNVNTVVFQKDKAEQFYHKYSYDADNRITHVETSRDGIHFEKDAKYFYYQHGPLARVELGSQKVQAEDFAYTIQGWIKAVNGEEVNASTMMGGDGNVDTLLGKKSLNSHVAKDVFGYSLSYHSNDYLSSNISMLNYSNQDKTTSLGGLDLYNGNIKSMYTALSNTYESAFKPQTEVMNQAFKTHNTIYRYDQLNRLVAWRGYNRELSNTTPTLSGYSGTFNYDADGNILNLVQRSLAVSSDKTTFEEKEKDDFSYNYISGTNQLDYVDDYTPTDNFTNDIDPGQHAGNYQYDQIGQLIKDSSEEIERIHWNLKNKVTRIDYTGTKQGKSITFDYDAMGRRIAKHSKTPNGEITSTYYMLDAQGNTMSMFSKSSTSTKMYCDEFSIFGSKRIGTLYTALELIPNATNSTIYNMFDEPIGFYSISVNPDGSFGEAEILRSASRYSSIYSRTYGDKTYELQNHLSSVLQVITDRKIPEGLRGGLITSFKAEVRTVTDYAPFGSMLEGRSNSTLTALPPHNLHATKRGYQESERDDDVKGDGNSYTTFYRMHDPRLGRWFSTDPVFQPWQSPYNSMDNNPIWHNDVLGDWVKGAGFWRNMKSSDGQIKAEDFSMSKPGSTLSDLGNGNWGVSWITKEKIVAKNIDGNYFDKEILVGNIKAFSDKKSNDLIENDNALFNFMEVLSYGFSHLYGSKDNFGKHEGGSDAFNGGVTRELPDAIGGSFSYGAHGGVGGAEGAGLVIFTDGKDAGIHLYTFDAKGIGVNAGVGVNFYTGNHIGNPNDMKSDFAGDGYDAGGDLFFGGNVWGTLKDDGRGKTSVGWAGVGISVGISVGSNSDKTNTKF